MGNKAIEPINWDDCEGWETYYQHCQDAIGQFNHEVTDFLSFCQDYSLKKIWFPGCGVSGAPHVYREFGFQVWATDIAPTAIEVQHSLSRFSLAELCDKKVNEFYGKDFWDAFFHIHTLPKTSSGELNVMVHDFRSPFAEQDFDGIINCCAFQGLSPDSMDKAARVHFDALRPGGHAMFLTLNLAPGGRMETSLRQAGFYVANWRLATRIPFHQNHVLREIARYNIPIIYENNRMAVPKNLERYKIPVVYENDRLAILQDAPKYRGIWGKFRLRKDRKTIQRWEKQCEAVQRETEEFEKSGSSKVAHIIYAS